MNPSENPDHPHNSPEFHTGKSCVEPGCCRPAGTAWSPLWCQPCNAKRLSQVSTSLRDLCGNAEGASRTPEASKPQASELTEWPGQWRQLPPQVDEHPDGAELGWVVRGHPFNRPVLARSNVGVRKLASPESGFGPFVRVELMADGMHGQQASDHAWFGGLEWRGPLVLPKEG